MPCNQCSSPSLCDGVCQVFEREQKDAEWVQRLRETAAHLRDNSISLAKYPGMATEARARMLAALYIEEIASLHEAKAKPAGDVEVIGTAGMAEVEYRSCGEEGFDLLGLKGHLEHGDCEPYNELETPHRWFSTFTASPSVDSIIQPDSVSGMGNGEGRK